MEHCRGRACPARHHPVTTHLSYKSPQKELSPMPNYSQKRKISPLAIIAIILILLALGMLFLIFAPGRG